MKVTKDGVLFDGRWMMGMMVLKVTEDEDDSQVDVSPPCCVGQEGTAKTVA
jgi:hypothetical protein